VQGIALGKSASDPLTVFVQRRSNENSAEFIDPFGSVVVTIWESDYGILVLDSVTLRQGAWAQPKNGFRISVGANNAPQRIIGSLDGKVLTLPQRLLLLGAQHSLLAPLNTGTPNPFAPYYGNATGSITGIVAADSRGNIYHNGLYREEQPPPGLAISPCGRYAISPDLGTGLNTQALEVRTVEGRRPLFRIYRLPGYDGRFSGTWGTSVSMIGESGPVLIWSANRKFLQLIALDLPAVAKGVAPEAFHVVSQPVPHVFEGGIYSYQVQVNNPERVARYQLRRPVPGAMLSATGALQYRAPALVEKALRVDFSLEILSTNGETQLHEFPIHVLPRPKVDPSPGARARSNQI
jgi:hypothetical protein